MRRLYWLILLQAGCASSLDYRGKVAVEGRYYPLPPKYDGESSGSGVSMVAEPEAWLQSEDNKNVLTLRPFLRLDAAEPERDHWDLRRLDEVYSGEGWEFGAGVNVFDWRVLESHGLVDVLSAPDYAESLDGREKLGTPYLEVGWLPGDWALRAYVLPWFRPPTFPGERSRLRFAAPVDPEHAIYSTALGAFQPSFALRLSGAWGPLDLGVSLFSGVSREPRFIAQLTDPKVVAAYDLVHQLSLDLRWTYGPISLKAEGFARLRSPELSFFWAAGGGLDYSFFDLFGSGADLSLAAEFIYDARPKDAALSFFQHDVFFGLRLALNDEGSAQLLGGVITDVVDLRTYVRARAERRFGERFKLFLEVDAFLGNNRGVEAALVQEHFGQLGIGYYL